MKLFEIPSLVNQDSYITKLKRDKLKKIFKKIEETEKFLEELNITKKTLENEIFNEEHPSKSLVSVKRESIGFNEKRNDIENFDNEVDLIDRKRGTSKEMSSYSIDRKKNQNFVFFNNC